MFGNVCRRARIISLLNSTVISKTWIYEHITISFVPYTQYLTGNRYGSEQVSTRRGIFRQWQLQCKSSSCCIIFKLPWRKNLPAKAGDRRGWIPGWERSPGGGHGNPFQYGKSPWTEEHEGLLFHSVAKSQTQLKLGMHTHLKEGDSFLQIRFLRHTKQNANTQPIFFSLIFRLKDSFPPNQQFLNLCK